MKHTTFFFYLLFTSVFSLAQVPVKSAGIVKEITGTRSLSGPCPDSTLIVNELNGVVCYGDTAKISIEGSEAGTMYKAVLNTAVVSDTVAGGGNIILSVCTSGLDLGKNTFRIVASKTGCPDVLLKFAAVFFVLPSPEKSNFKITLRNKYACPATPVSVIAQNVNPVSTYNLYVNDVLQNGTVKKDGDSWELPGDYKNMNLRVEENLNSANCPGVYTIYDTIFMIWPNTHLHVTVDTPCYGQMATIRIYDTEAEYKYVVISNNDGTAISDTVYGDGNLAVVPLSLKMYGFCGTHIRIYSAHKNSNTFKCPWELEESPVILIHDMSADFKTSFPGGIPGDVFTITNNSKADSILWKIDGSLSSKYAPDPISFTTPGIKNITLITHIDSTGCYDTLRRNLEIVDHISKAPGIACEYQSLEKIADPLLDFFKPLHAFHVDKDGNRYVADRIRFNEGGENSGAFGLSLKKYDKNNQLLWEKKHDPWNSPQSLYYFWSDFVVDIESDNTGNSYIAGHFSGKDFEWDNMKLHYDWSQTVGYLIKLNADGVVQWVIHSDALNDSDHPRTAFTDIIYVDDNTIYASIAHPQELSFPDGSKQVLDSTDLAVIHIDKDGKLINMFSTTPTHSDALIYQANMDIATYIVPKTELVSPKMAITSSGKIVVGGKSKGMISFGNLTYSAKPNETTQFIALLDPKKGWEKVFNAYTFDWTSPAHDIFERPYSIEPLFTVDKNDDLFITDHFYSYQLNNSVKINGDFNILKGVRGAFTAKFNLDGDLQWFDSTTCSYTGGIIEMDDEVMVYGMYGDFYATGSRAINRVGMRGKGDYDISLTSYTKKNGKVNWVEAIASNVGDANYKLIKDQCGENAYFLGGVDKSTSFMTKNLTVNEYSIFIGKYAPKGNCECGITGMDKPNTQDASVTVYPNPASDKLIITSSEIISEVIIKNAIGETLLSLNANGNLTQTLNIAHLPAAAYFIDIKTKSGNTTKKFFIIN
jgi:hypothetical protein